MSQIIQNLGKIVPNHRGSFKPDVQYRVMDEVFYFGASYRAVELPPLGTIPTNEDYWVIVSESSARLTDVDVVDTSVNGEVTIKFTYEDLTTYEVTTGPLMPALVNPDWEATSGPTQILNKPSLGNAAYASIGDTPGSVSAGDHRHDNATTSVDGFLSAADKTKLNGIATGATANNTNSYLLDRGNHTNTQSMSTIDGLIAALNAKLNSSTAGAPSGVATLDVNGRLPILQGGGQPIIQLDISTGDLTPSGFNTALGHVGFYKIASTVGSPITYPATWTSAGLGGYGTVEGYNYNANDYVYSYQIASSNTGNKWMRRATSSTTWGAWVEQVSASVATTSANGLMSAADKVKLNGIATAATANQTDAYLLNRANHTNSQAISTVSGLQAALDAKANSSQLSLKADLSALNALDSRITNAGLVANVPTFSGSVNDLTPGTIVGQQMTDDQAVAADLPSLNTGSGSHVRWWNIFTYGMSGGSPRITQIATEVFGIGAGNFKGRTFTRVRHDSDWSTWLEVASTQYVDNSKGSFLNQVVFNTSGTWIKPAGLSSEALVMVELWGGGGGGGRGNNGGSAGYPGGGGGGGGYYIKIFKAGDLSNTVEVTVGAGGLRGETGSTSGSPGGDSSFGTYAYAYGGGGGRGANGNGTGGGGGGQISKGENGGSNLGGFGGKPNIIDINNYSLVGMGGSIASKGSDGFYYHGGGGGGGGQNTSGVTGGNGGDSLYGGGGGGGGGQSTSFPSYGGVSTYGGNGASFDTEAEAPGGGGRGSNRVTGSEASNGAPGRVSVRVIG